MIKSATPIRRAFCLFLILFPGTALLPVHLKFRMIKMQRADLFVELDLEKKGLDKKVFDFAVRGYSRLCFEQKILRPGLLSVADFSKSSSFPRLFVIDLENRKLLFQTLVAHGRNSGEEFATAFGNTPNSLKSSLGFFITGQPYAGAHGTSLRLSGCEIGINDKAEGRGIVLHGASYVSKQFIACNGRLGRSHGCPAVPDNLCGPIVESIRGGTCLFIYYPDSAYLVKSHFLN